MNRRTSLACVIVTAIAAPASAFTALSGAVANDPSQIALGVATISVLGGLWSIPRVEASGSAELEPVPEMVPQWLWRANLDAALEDMTLQNPTIDYDRVNSWTPYAESAPGRSCGPVSRKEELIRKSVGHAYLQVEPSTVLKAQAAAYTTPHGVDLREVNQGYQAGSALEDEIPATGFDDAELVWDPQNEVLTIGGVRVCEPREITTWGSATPLRVQTHLMF